MDSDEDDLFVYGDDGTPTGMKASVLPVQLTAAELHDVTVATLAANAFEAMALIDALADAGIPAMKRSDTIHMGHFGAPEVLVPRKLLGKANAVIERFRGQASERGVEDAFKTESIVDQLNDTRRTPEMALMTSLAHAYGAERETLLFDFVAHAIAQGMPAPELARHLAAAGLDRAEADAVIANVKGERINLVRAKLDMQRQSGLALAALGFVGFAVSIGIALFVGLSVLRGDQKMALLELVTGSSIGVIVGLGISAHAKGKISSLGNP